MTRNGFSTFIIAHFIGFNNDINTRNDDSSEIDHRHRAPSRAAIETSALIAWNRFRDEPARVSLKLNPPPSDWRM